jgi:hypothetical protein
VKALSLNCLKLISLCLYEQLFIFTITPLYLLYWWFSCNSPLCISTRLALKPSLKTRAHHSKCIMLPTLYAGSPALSTAKRVKSICNDLSDAQFESVKMIVEIVAEHQSAFYRRQA